MAKKNKVAETEVVEVAETEVVGAESIISQVMEQIPGLESAKEKLSDYLSSESEHRTGKSIAQDLVRNELDPVIVLESQISMYKDSDKDRAQLAAQKLELVKRYNEWKEGAAKLKAEVEESYKLLDEVIDGLRAIRGKSTRSGNSGGTGSRSCEVINMSDSTVMSFSSLNSAVDELVPKDKRSPKWVKGEEGDRVDSKGFKLDEDGNRIPEYDKSGNMKYFSLSAKNAISALKTAGYEVNC